MRRTAAFLAVIALCSVGSVFAMYSIANTGMWPKTWPKELEPLRTQSRTVRGSLLDLTSYEIPFTKREDFESAWPHLLAVKSQGAPVVLLRGPDKKLGTPINAGVRIHVPPRLRENAATPQAPTPGATNVRERWLWATYLELVVDGEIIDLNRFPLPPDTPIIDQRFDDAQGK